MAPQDNKTLNKTNPRPPKQTSLETANAMFKEAFAMIKQRFNLKTPGLSDAELNRLTAEYIRQLPDENSIHIKLGYSHGPINRVAESARKVAPM